MVDPRYEEVEIRVIEEASSLKSVPQINVLGELSG